MKPSANATLAANGNGTPLRTMGAMIVAAAAMTIASPNVHGAAPPGGSTPTKANAPAKLEAIPGSAVKRITLVPKAAERLGIATGKVGMEKIVRKQMVSGLVVPPLEKLPDARPAGGGFGGFGGFQPAATTQADAPQVAAKSADPNGAWVLVSVSKLEWERLARDMPARLFPLATRDPLSKETTAQPSGVTPIEDMRRSMLTLYYVVAGPDHGLKLNTRMRVELPLAGSDEAKKVIPYSAVYYDAKGVPWAYVNTAPLTFERHPLKVERIEGDKAILTEGPEVNTTIVTTGAALLFGIEVFGK